MEKNRRYFILFILALALSLRAYRLFHPDIIANDGVLYVEVARSILYGNFGELKETGFLNLYSAFIAVFYKFIGDWEMSGRLVSVIFGTLSIIPLYLLTKRLINEAIGLTLTFFYAICPHVVEYSSDILREPVFWFFLFASLYFGVTGLMDRKWPLVLLSSFLSLASIFTRIDGFVAPILFISWAIFLGLKKILSKREVCIYLSIYIFCYAIFVPAFLLSLSCFTSEWDAGPLGVKVKEFTSEARSSPGLVHKELTSVNDLPPSILSFIELSLRHKYMIYAFEILYKSFKSLGPVFLPLLAIGLLKNGHQMGHARSFFSLWILISFQVSYVHVLLNQYFATRHGLLIGIPALLWASNGFSLLFSVVQKKLPSANSPTKHSKFLSVILLLVVLSSTLPFNLGSIRGDKMELKQAGLYLKKSGIKEERIATLSHLSRILFYGQFRPVYLPDVVQASMLKAEMEKRNVRYLLLDEKTKRRFEKSGGIEHLGFQKIDVPLFETLREYSLRLYVLSPKVNGK